MSLLPVPTEAELAAAYSDTYYGEAQSKFIGPVEKVINYFRAGRARNASRYLKEGDIVLDIGCGNGGFLGSLSNLGRYDLHGIELPGKAAQRASQIPGVSIKEGTFQADDFAPNSVALVTMFHVLEHLPQPRITLELVSKILKPGGKLIVSFPNIQSMQAKTFRGDWLHIDPPRHLALFGTQNFPPLAKAAGLEVLRLSSWSLEQNPFGGIQSFLNLTRTAPRDALYEFLKGNKQYRQGPRLAQSLVHVGAAALLFPISLLEELACSPFARGATVEFLLEKANHV